MQEIRFIKYLVVPALALVMVGLFHLSFSAGAHSKTLSAEPQTDSASALSRGRTLLKQGHADQALSYLQNALSLYTQANNQRGIAAASDALGDLFLIQGQYSVALEHYKKAYEAFVIASGKDQKNQAVANTVASQAGATTAAATETAGSTADNGFNANLMLAKIGDTNYRLGQLTNASASYSRMTVKKPESAAAKATRRFGGLGGIIGSVTTGKVDIAAPTSGAIGLLETKKEMDEYRVAIVFMTYELGIEFRNSDRFHSCRDCRDNRFILLTQTGEDIGDEIFIFKLLACRSHVVGEAFHIDKVVSDRGRPPGRRSERHASGDDVGTRLGGMKALDRRPELSHSRR